jgi:hypothetical protein
LNAALCRGAATVQNKDWGAIILWKYTKPPYLETGEELYKDLVFAYDNGAKYILVFDSNEDHTQGTLRDEHLRALQQFYQYARYNPRKSHPLSERVALVLPNGYGYGFRGPNDRLWGKWEADSLSPVLWTYIYHLLDTYVLYLDIVYETRINDEPIDLPYSELVFWNGTLVRE